MVLFALLLFFFSSATCSFEKEDANNQRATLGRPIGLAMPKGIPHFFFSMTNGLLISQTVLSWSDNTANHSLKKKLTAVSELNTTKYELSPSLL